MLDKLLTVVTANAKLALAAVAGAALVAGGSAVAIHQVASTTDSTTSVNAPVKGGENASDEGVENRSDTATATIAPKPSKSPEASESPEPSESPKAEGTQGVHGACVSAVAHDKSKAGREHGKAVSEAAKSCPKDATESGSSASEAPRPSRSPEAADTQDQGDNASADSPDSEGGDSGGSHSQSGSHQHGKG